MSVNIAYIRVSTQLQADSGNSLEFQKKHILDYCHRHSLDLKEENIFVDVDSGANSKRVQFNVMHQFIKNSSGIKHLIVYSIDRLARNLLVGELVCKDVYDKGGSTISVSQGFNDALPTGRMTRQMFLIMAEQELIMINSRRVEGQKATVRKGLRGMGGAAPFGSSSAGSHKKGRRGFGKLVKNSKEVEAFELMQSLRERGVSYRGICTALEEKGIVSRRGEAFNPGTVKKLLDKEMLRIEDGVEIPENVEITEES